MSHLNSNIRGNPFLQKYNNEENKGNEGNEENKTNHYKNLINDYYEHDSSENDSSENEFNTLINKKKINKFSQTTKLSTKKTQNDKIIGSVNFITLVILLIMAILLYGMSNLYLSNKIIYGDIGFYAFQIYYIFHVSWYGIFLIIHIFLNLSHYLYQMDNNNYINHIIINYSHIYWIILVKIIFSCSIITILCFGNNYISDIPNIPNNNTNIIPLYFNLIYIENILSTLLNIYIDKIFLQNTIKKIQNEMV